MGFDVSHWTTERLELKVVTGGEDNSLFWLYLIAHPHKYWKDDPAKPAQMTIHAANAVANIRERFEAYAAAIAEVNARFDPPIPANEETGQEFDEAVRPPPDDDMPAF